MIVQRASIRGRCASGNVASSSARAPFTPRLSGCWRSPASGSTCRLYYWLGVAATAGLLVYEHSIVRPGDLRRLDAAFFTLNGVISVVFFAFAALDVLVG